MIKNGSKMNYRNSNRTLGGSLSVPGNFEVSNRLSSSRMSFIVSSRLSSMLAVGGGLIFQLPGVRQ